MLHALNEVGYLRRVLAVLAGDVDLREVERAHGVERDALPARRREGCGVAGVLQAALAAYGHEDVGVYEHEQQKAEHHEHKHQNDLAASMAWSGHCR